ARDLYQIPKSALVARAERATAVVTECRASVEYLASVVPPASAGRVKIIRNGLSLHEFRPRKHNGDAPGPPLLLSVGRLVEKKGFGDLLAACRRLKDSGRPFRCHIVGEGPERGRLTTLLQELDLGDRVSLEGTRTRRQIMDAYRQADVFALTPFVTEDGDRAGIPTVLVEAIGSAGGWRWRFALLQWPGPWRPPCTGPGSLPRTGVPPATFSTSSTCPAKHARSSTSWGSAWCSGRWRSARRESERGRREAGSH